MKTTTTPIFHTLARCFLGAGFLILAFIQAVPSSYGGIEAVRVASGFALPLYVSTPPGDTSRIFVAEQHGKIKIVNLPSGTVNAIPFLDITSRVGQGQGTGILGMAFDPNYAVNGRFYVSYTTNGGGVFDLGVSHVARFNVTANPSIADPASEVTVITVDKPSHEHNFDWIGFGPRAGDAGNLYICAGDGGVDFLPDGNAQNTTTLLGKILRIHLEDDGTYTIPPDNPFFGSATERQEIWAFGLRNPFRASFDSVTHDMLIGDVGETAREEVDVNPPSNPGGGENYGWRLLEGNIRNPRFAGDPLPPNPVYPILDYEHSTTGICVIGGYVYRGSAVGDLEGLYVFGDCFGPSSGDFTGRIFTLLYEGGVASNFTDITSQLFPTKIRLWPARRRRRQPLYLRR
jgi:glucose/arabinose dehydrogenase